MSSVRTYVSTSDCLLKVFLIRMEFRARRMMHVIMPYDPIQGQGHETLEVEILVFSKSISSIS